MQRFYFLAFFGLAQATNAQIPTVAASQSPPSLSLRHLDVGQGSATLLTTPEGKRVLIDAGPARTAVAEALRAERIDTLDLVVASHAHHDHIGGLAEVFDAVVVRAYLDNGIPHSTATYSRVIASARNEPGLLYFEPSERTITVGSVSIRVLPPPLTRQSQNNNSVGVLVEYGKFRALYTGDSERSELAHWLNEGRVPRVTLVKAAHHGSRNGVTSEWIRATSPALVVISLGARNSYGHPSPQVEQEWRAAKACVYRTDVEGEVEVKAMADGSFTVSTSRTSRSGGNNDQIC